MNIRRTGDSREQRERRSIHGHSGNGDGEAGFEASAAATGSWDPYQVWLTRVKQPREEIERARTRSSRPTSARSAKDDGSNGLQPILHR